MFVNFMGLISVFIFKNQAHVCIYQKRHDFKLMIFGKAANLTYDIPVFEDGSSFTIKQIAISGTRVTLLLISHKAAYRMLLHINGLEIINSVPLQYIGHANELVWQPLVDSDVYLKINGSNFVDTVRLFYENVSSSENISNSYQPCNKFKEFKILVVRNTTLTDKLPAVLPYNYLIIIICVLSVSLLLTCGFIAVFVFLISKKRGNDVGILRSVDPLTCSHVFPPPYETHENNYRRVNTPANIRVFGNSTATVMSQQLASFEECEESTYSNPESDKCSDNCSLGI
uniref:Uncharacterized protein n=1 Tax=Panagrolaimus superbus TaxID=310955 RepID=A0A914YVT7_9BILA